MKSLLVLVAVLAVVAGGPISEEKHIPTARNDESHSNPTAANQRESLEGLTRRKRQYLQRPFNLQPFNPQPFNPQPFNPHPFNPQPFNPQPFNPQPFNPQPFIIPQANSPPNIRIEGRGSIPGQSDFNIRGEGVIWEKGNNRLSGYGTIDQSFGVPPPRDRPQFGGGLTFTHKF